MTIPRVVALAQALAMIMILVPGIQGSGPAPALAATGSGVGCETGADRFRGPRSPGDPPWPPGAEPTPTPEPSLEPSPSPAVDDAADSPTIFLAATGIRVAQADPTLQPTPTPAPAQATPTPVLPTEEPSISGIDVSHHNGDVDFQKVRDAGYDFVYLKTTQDNDFIDPMFATNLERARAAGLAAGGYHFFDYTLDGDVQADHFLDRLEAAGGLEDALPPVVDVECWSPIGLSIHAVSTARLRDFVARVYERTGRLPIDLHLRPDVEGGRRQRGRVRGPAALGCLLGLRGSALHRPWLGRLDLLADRHRPHPRRGVA